MRPSGAVHLGKHRVLVDGPVLHSSPALPDDLLVLLEPPVQQEHLTWKGEGRGHAYCHEIGQRMEGLARLWILLPSTCIYICTQAMHTAP